MATLSLTCVNLPLVLVYKKTSFHSEVFKFEVILGLAIDIVSNLVFWSRKMNKLVLLHIYNFCQQ